MDYNDDDYWFYEILNCYNDCTEKSIIENFKKITIKFHYKRSKDFDNLEKSKKRFYYVLHSYFFLINSEHRKLYDEFLKNKSDELKNKIDEILEKNEELVNMLMKLNYQHFIKYLKTELKLLTTINAQIAIGLYYEEIELEKQESGEINIDPEDIKPKVALFVEVFTDYFKIMAVIAVIFTLFYIISYFMV